MARNENETGKAKDRKITEDGARRKAAGQKTKQDNAARTKAEQEAARSPKER